MTPEQLLQVATRRIRWILAQRAFVRWAWIAALASVIVMALARSVTWQPTETIGLVAPAVAVVIGAWWASRRHLPAATVARVVDAQLSTHDALGANLQFRHDTGPFATRIEQRARAVAASSDLAAAVPRRLVGERRFVQRRLSAALLAALAAATLAVIDNPQDLVRAQAERERAAIEAARKDLERAAGELGADTNAGKALEKLARDLADLDADSALDRLADAEADLQLRAGRNLDSALAANAGLDASVRARPLPGAQPGANAAEQLAQAAEALEGMTTEERAELAERLAGLAATQVAGAPEVADALQKAATALASGSGDAAAALAAAGAAQGEQASSVASRSKARSAAAAAGAARSAVAGSRSSGVPGQGQGNGKGSGNGKGNGKGNGDGKGSGQGSGQGSGGSPSGQVGAGTRPGGGSGQGGKGQAGNNGTGLGDSRNEQTAPPSEVYAPDPRGTSDGEGPLSGEGGDLGQEVGKGQAPSSRGSATLPLSDAVAKYREQAAQAMNDPEVPAASRDLMARYFEQLTAAKG